MCHFSVYEGGREGGREGGSERGRGREREEEHEHVGNMQSHLKCSRHRLVQRRVLVTVPVENLPQRIGCPG